MPMAKKQTPKLPKKSKKIEETKEIKKKEASESLPKSEGNGYDKIIKENLEEIFRPLIERKLSAMSFWRDAKKTWPPLPICL